MKPDEDADEDERWVTRGVLTGLDVWDGMIHVLLYQTWPHTANRQNKQYSSAELIIKIVTQTFNTVVLVYFAVTLI